MNIRLRSYRPGADVFLYKAISESGIRASARDMILDFSREDRIDLSAIDAIRAVAGNQAFSFMGTKAFTGRAGELRYEKMASDTDIHADTNGDRIADFSIRLDDAMTLSKGLFIL